MHLELLLSGQNPTRANILRNSALPDYASDPTIIDLQHNTVSPHLHKQPPNKENITDSNEVLNIWIKGWD